MSIQLRPEWQKYLKAEFEQPYMTDLQNFLKIELEKKKIIFPEPKNYFQALNFVAPQEVKVVILGQDPYHGPGQAHGLSFSVQKGIRFPPSLKNIFKELNADLGLENSTSGDLTQWAQQGVVLLNSVLTVESGLAGSHQKRGWEQFTDRVIEVIATQSPNCVFILWGAYAQKKAAFVNRDRHLVLESVHPSPLSSHRGFFGSKPFSKTNQFLIQKGLTPIDWSLGTSQQIPVSSSRQID